MPMRELFPGVLHWTATKESIGLDVSSYLVEPAGVLIDPMVPDEGLERLQGVRQIVLTSGNHTRDAERIAEATGATIRASREGQERIAGERAIATEAYADGEEIAGGVRAIKVGVLSPDEYALHLTATEPALVIADGAEHYGDALGFFGDHLLGDEPEAVKDGLRTRFRALLDLDFEHLLVAHGSPIVGGGRAALAAFAGS